MKKYLVILIMLAPAAEFGQDLSVGIAPASFSLWGTTTGTSSVYAEYEFSGIFGSPIVGAYYFHQWDKKGVYRLNDVRGIKKTQTVGLAFTPLNLRYVRAGMILTGKEFPMSHHVRRNFMISLVLPINRFEIKYIHISNGFGLFHDINVGLDTISLSIKF